MARQRRKVTEKNYVELIKNSEEKIQKLTAELKEEKAVLKQLKKDKATYDIIREEELKKERLQKIASMIEASGKSLDEIEAILNANHTIQKTNEKEDKE